MEGIAQKVEEKYHKSPFHCVFLLFFPFAYWTALQNHPASIISRCIFLQLSFRVEEVVHCDDIDWMPEGRKKALRDRDVKFCIDVWGALV